MNAKQLLNTTWNYAKQAVSGSSSRQKMQQALVTTDPTAGYGHSKFYDSNTIVNNLPLYTMWAGRLMLNSDPVVEFSLNVRNAALMVAEVEIKAKNGRVQQWLDAQWNTIWELNRDKILAAKKWGFAGLQPTYKFNQTTQLLDVDGLKDFAPEDVRALESKGKQVGFRVKDRRLFGPRSLWLTFNSEYGSPYGKGTLQRSYPPWYEKWMDRGAKKLVQQRMIKDAYVGDIFWTPFNMMVELPDGRQIPWRDLARQVAENRMSGGAMVLPMLRNDKGEKLMEYEPPQSIQGGTDIFTWLEKLDEDILRGADIPIEVIKASETGSGYSGRSIPFMVLLSVCGMEFTEYVKQIQELLRVVAWLNFGGDPEFEMKPKSLVESFAGDAAGSPMGGGAIGGQPGQAGGQGGQGGMRPPQPQPQSAGGVQFADDAVDFPSGKKPLHAPAGGVTIHGVRYEGGEFIPDEVVDELSDEEQSKLRSGVAARNAKTAPVAENFRDLAAKHPALAKYADSFEKVPKKKGGQVSHLNDEQYAVYKDLAMAKSQGKITKEEWEAGLAAIKEMAGTQFAEEILDPVPHEFSSTQFNLSGELAFDLRRMADRIDHDDLAGDGRELNPHITIKYGLHTNNADDVRAVVEGEPPVAVTFGKTSVFAGAEHDVVKIEIESEALRRLNAHIASSLACTDTFPDYQPHCTVAYVKPGMGERYAAALNDLQGKVAIFDRLVFSGKTREHTSIPLMGAAQFSEGKTRFDLSDSSTSTLDEITAIGTAAARRRILTAAEQIRALAQKKTAELATDATTFEGLGKFSLLADIRAVIEALHRGISSDLQTSMLAANFAGAAEVAVGIPPAHVPPVVTGAPPIVPPTPPTLASLFPDEPAPGLRFPVIDDALTILHDAEIFTSDDYREVAEQAKAGAFAITSTLGDEAVSDIRDLLQENIAKGPDMEAFVDKVQERLREGNPLSERHIETIFRTNVSSAFSNGSNKSLEAPMVVDAFPYRQYWATTDQRVRKTHIALETLGLQGTNIYRADDPVWQKFRPPWEFNCRCSWNPVTVEQAARKGITEAQEWLARAKDAAKANGGEWPEWLNKTAPARGEWVSPPAFEPPAEFRRV